MSDVSVKCVFCQKETLEKIKHFTPETLKKCVHVLEYRKAKPVVRRSSNTYATVELSEETSLNDGYHAQCYKLFTAVKILSDVRPKQIAPESEQTRRVDAPELAGESLDVYTPSTSIIPAVDRIDEAGPSTNPEPHSDDYDDPSDVAEQVIQSDLLLKDCFICNKSRKRRLGRDVPLAINKFRTIELLKSAATEYNDIEMLEKISSYADSSAIPYHKCCKDLYLRGINKKEESDFMKKRKASNTAYELLCEMIEELVVKKNECLFFDHVKKEYHKLLVEQCKFLSDSISRSSFSDHHLESKIMDTFSKTIVIIYAEKKRFLAPISADIMAYKDLFKNMSMKETIRSVAAQLREEIQKFTTTKLPDDCTAEDLIRDIIKNEEKRKEKRPTAIADEDSEFENMEVKDIKEDSDNEEMNEYDSNKYLNQASTSYKHLLPIHYTEAIETDAPKRVKVENLTTIPENGENVVTLTLNEYNNIISETSGLQTENKILKESILKFQNLKEETERGFKAIQGQLDKLFDILKHKQSDIETVSAVVATKFHEEIAQRNIEFPINSIEELELLEDQLIDTEFEKVLITQFSSICGTSGMLKISKVGLQLTRRLFTDELLYQFTWKGIKGCNKIPFMNYIKIRNLFFKIIHLADKFCSMKDSDAFLQNSAIKHSGQRIKRKSSDMKIINQKKTKTEVENKPTAENDDPSSDNLETIHATVQIKEEE